MEAGVRQLDLGLDASDAGDTEMRKRSATRITQKSGLSHPGLSADDHRGTLTGPHPVAKAVELAKLVVPPVELDRVAGHEASIMADPELVSPRFL
jgi:hypothetical protein